MLLDDNCIRLDKIPDSHPLASRLFANPKCPVAQTFAEIVQASTFFPSPEKLTRSRKWHYGIISGRKSSAGVSYIGSNCLHIWWTTAVERRAQHYRHLFQHRSPVISAHERAWNSICWNQYFRHEYQDFFTQNYCSGVNIYTIMYFLYNNSQFIMRRKTK